MVHKVVHKVVEKVKVSPCHLQEEIADQSVHNESQKHCIQRQTEQTEALRFVCSHISSIVEVVVRCTLLLGATAVRTWLKQTTIALQLPRHYCVASTSSGSGTS